MSATLHVIHAEAALWQVHHCALHDSGLECIMEHLILWKMQCAVTQLKSLTLYKDAQASAPHEARSYGVCSSQRTC